MPQDSSMISFEKVLREDNSRIMLDCKQIATGDDGQIVIFQSENRNVITIVHGQFYYHITLEDIVNAVLMSKLDKDVEKLECK